MRVLLLAFALLLSAPAFAEPLAAIAFPRDDLPWWRARHAAKMAEAAHGADLVLLGDSITQQLEHPDYAPVRQRFFAGLRVLDLGFTGDTTSHLLWRLTHGELDGLKPGGLKPGGLKPGGAIILIGANNLGRVHWPAADDLAGIDAVVAATRAKLPGTPILLLAVLPSDRGPWVRAQETAIDAALAKRYGAGAVPGVAFYDPTPLFLTPDGRVDQSEYRDPPKQPALHPSPQGMTKLFAAIEPTLASWFGTRPR